MLSERLFNVAREMMGSLLAEEPKEGARRGCHLVVVSGSSAHAVENVEKIPVDGF